MDLLDQYTMLVISVAILYQVKHAANCRPKFSFIVCVHREEQRSCCVVVLLCLKVVSYSSLNAFAKSPTPPLAYIRPRPFHSTVDKHMDFIYM